MAQRGGKRPGAGRKSSEVLAARRVTAAQALSAVDERRVWVSLISSKDERIKLDAMKYLTDRRDGKAIPTVGNSGNPSLRVICDI